MRHHSNSKEQASSGTWILTVGLCKRSRSLLKTTMCEISGRYGRKNTVLPLNGRAAEMMFLLRKQTTIVGQHLELQGKLQTPPRSRTPRLGASCFCLPSSECLQCCPADFQIHLLTGSCSRTSIAKLEKL